MHMQRVFREPAIRFATIVSFFFILPVHDLHAASTASTPQEKIGYDPGTVWRSVQQTDGWTSLTLSVLEGDTKKVDAWLHKGADVNTRDAFGRSLLLLATEYNCGDMIKHLLQRGADPNLTKTGRTPLLATVAQGNLERTKYLLDHGAELNTLPADAIAVAVKDGSIPMVQFLLDKGFDVNGGGALGPHSNPLHQAVLGNQIEMARFLLEHGANPVARINSSDNIFFIAIDKSNTAMVEEFLRHGVDVNAELYGTSPLYRAVCAGRIDMVKLLLDYGADAGWKTKSNWSALDAARYNKDNSLIDLLTKVGAKPGGARVEKPVLAEQEPAFSKIIKSTEHFTTDSLKAAVRSDEPQYRIEASYFLNKKMMEHRKKDSPLYDTEYFLMVQGSPERISLGRFEWSSRGVDNKSFSARWLDKDHLLTVSWVEELEGNGRIVVNHQRIFVLSHQKPVLVFEESTEAGGKSGWRHRSSRYDLEWNKDAGELTVLRITTHIRPVDQGSYDAYASQRAVYHYRLDDETMRYRAGEQYALDVKGKPSLDVAEQYDVELKRLKQLNPSLRSKIFCEGPVLLSNELKEPEHEY